MQNVTDYIESLQVSFGQTTSDEKDVTILQMAAPARSGGNSGWRSSPLRRGGLGAAAACQSRQRVLSLAAVPAAAAQAHVDGLAAGVHAADGGEAHAAAAAATTAATVSVSMSSQRALSALGGGAAESGAPGEAAGGAGGGRVDRARTGGLGGCGGEQQESVVSFGFQLLQCN